MRIKTHDQLLSHVVEQLNTHLADTRESGNQRVTLLAGLSGGLDSVVLLHLLSRAVPLLENVTLSALHVNHGVNDSSQMWSEFCRQYCDQLQVPLHISQHKLDSVKNNREAVFRELRYRVFMDHLPDTGVLLTAHHQNDQAETLLFNLFRGAGLRGLSAMMPIVALGKGSHLRPLLSVARSLLKDYAQHHDLRWVNDPSNDDTGLDRNYIRHAIMPVIRSRWPAAQSAISRAGINLRQAEEIIEEIGVRDAEYCSLSDYPGVIKNAYLAALSISKFHTLSRARQINALRRWILINTGINPAAVQLRQIRDDLCTESASGLFEIHGYQLRVFKDILYLMKALPKSVEQLEMPLIENGCYVFKSITLGVKLHPALSVEPEREYQFRPRRGGEKIRHHGQSQRLKSLYQQNAIPTWERQLIPLIYSRDRLIAVPGVVLADDCPVESASVSLRCAHDQDT